MSVMQKKAMFSTIIWSIITVVFVLLFVSGDGPDSFVKGKQRRNIAAGFVGAGIVLHLILARVFRKTKSGQQVLVDERDENIAGKASVGSSYFIAVFVFAFCIIVEEKFMDAGSVPVSWIWFLAYMVMIFTYFIPAAASLIIYFMNSTNE